MEMTGTREMPAPTDAVWRALNDPAVLKECIVGCESIQPDGNDSYTMVLATKVGPVAARFSGKMRLAELEPRRSYTLHFEGSGGVAGFAKGEGRVTLVPTGPDATRLEYVAKAQVGGKLAQVGSRLIDGAAQRLAEDFFERFVMAVAPAADAQPASVATARPAAAERSRRRIAYAIVAIAAAVVAMVLLWRALAERR
jgi:carbon monoxide dehydrogenase subunit G